jgi:hypothetical protein
MWFLWLLRVDQPNRVGEDEVHDEQFVLVLCDLLCFNHMRDVATPEPNATKIVVRPTAFSQTWGKQKDEQGSKATKAGKDKAEALEDKKEEEEEEEG